MSKPAKRSLTHHSQNKNNVETSIRILSLTPAMANLIEIMIMLRILTVFIFLWPNLYKIRLNVLFPPKTNNRLKWQLGYHPSFIGLPTHYRTYRNYEEKKKEYWPWPDPWYKLHLSMLRMPRFFKGKPEITQYMERSAATTHHMVTPLESVAMARCE